MLPWLRHRRTGRHAMIDGLREEITQMRAEQQADRAQHEADRARMNDAIEAMTIRDAARQAQRQQAAPPAALVLAAQQGRPGGQAVAVPGLDGQQVIIVIGDHGCDPAAAWSAVSDRRSWNRLAS